MQEERNIKQREKKEEERKREKFREFERENDREFLEFQKSRNVKSKIC